MPLVEDEFLGDANCQMSLAGADLPDDQESHAIARIILLRKPGGGEVGKRERGMGAWKIRSVTG